MRAGKLNTLAKLWTLVNEPPVPSLIGDRWIGVSTPATDQDVPPVPGLRSAVPTTIRARADAQLYAGRYLAAGVRLWHIDSTRDPDGKGSDAILTCTALVGEPATYYAPGDAAGRAVRAAIVPAATLTGDHARIIDYRQAIELCLFEVSRPPKGARVRVRNVTWQIVGLEDNGDDGVVQRYAVAK